MSSPAEFYKSLPPVTKFYGSMCLAFTVACQLGILSPFYFALFYRLVFYGFQVHRLFATFFFLGKFSINFGIRLLMIVRYGAQLENGAFQGRTADFLWMVLFGAFTLLAFYLPWAMLCLDVLFGSSIIPDLLGIIAGHLYYFLAVLHPLATGRNILRTPRWLHKVVARSRYLNPTSNSAARADRTGSAFGGRSHRLGG